MPTGSFLNSLFAIIFSPIPIFSRKDTANFLNHASFWQLKRCKSIPDKENILYMLQKNAFFLGLIHRKNLLLHHNRGEL